MTRALFSLYKTRMIKLAFKLFFLAALTVSSSAFACPLGAGESQLSLTRVMRNFGKYLAPAEASIRKGLQAPESVTDQELLAVGSALKIALGCADLAASDRSGNLFPRKSSELSGEARERFLRKFFANMNAFAEEIREYARVFSELSVMPAGERAYAAAREQLRLVMAAADHAHKSLE